MPPPRSTAARSSWIGPTLAAVVALGVVAARPVARHLEAVAVLERLQGATPRGLLAGSTHPVQEKRVTVRAASGAIDARLYWPTDLDAAPAVVVLHGVHRLGMDEPRLVGFSRALAAAGMIVLTPQLPGFADYRVDESSMVLIGDAARALAAATGARRVGILGLSFAGGLALLAAADPRWADSIAYVVGVGAHDDMFRVMRFFVTGEAPRPDGTVQRMAPHEYGELVVAYSHIDYFFAPADRATAHEAIRLYLAERPNDARALAQTLAPEARQKMEDIFAHRRGWLDAALLAEIEHHRDEMERVSPHGKLGALEAPVLLLHGEGDDVIPASETLWLEREVPRAWLRAALVSRAVSHVELGGKPTARDRFALVHWTAELLETAHTAPKGRRPDW